MMFSHTTHKGESSSSSFEFESSQLCRHYAFSEIQVATQNFDESLVIGCGGFGKVYKGTITYGATHLTVAIKRLDVSSDQGAPEFWAEVKMLSKLRHCHLVSLIGYCNDGKEMILVYEYMPHGTLEYHLHKRATSLAWMRRLQICIGAARGLDYLHTGTGIKQGVIHRDVKSSNVLLDDNWAAKISDFGLSKIGPINQQSTYVNTLVKGTFGYFDPDYFATGRLTRKSDVFAFGVILFEVLCGKKTVDKSLDEEHWGLVQWAQDSIKEGRIKQIVDSSIRECVSLKCLKKFVELANRCLHSHPKHRPTMAQVVAGLEYVLANNATRYAGKTIFGKKVPLYVFPSNEKYSDGDLSLNSLRHHLHTIQDENHKLRRFDYDTIHAATENFSKANKVSQARFKSMYKGRLQNGQLIAVAKSFSNRFVENHMREASILVKCEHDNLVKLLGYCIERKKVFLVYEFASNASLYHLLHDPMSTHLEWNKLNKMIIGVAKVLVYLHNHAPMRIIHNNLGSWNILLDESFYPKLSDFRFATAINETNRVATAINETDCVATTINETDPITTAINETDYVTTAIDETDFFLPPIQMPDFPVPPAPPGPFMAPEYKNQEGVLSTKEDVYSLGLMVLEIIAGDGRPDISLFLNNVRRNWLERSVSNIIDPRIDADSSSITRFLEIGLLCVQEDAAYRPEMEEVVSMLLDTSSHTLPVSKMRAKMLRWVFKKYEWLYINS